jgi:hypothetical protein
MVISAHQRDMATHQDLVANQRVTMDDAPDTELHLVPEHNVPMGRP